MEISCSGSKDLASSSTLLSAPIRWNLTRGRDFFEVIFKFTVFCGDGGRKSRVDQRDSENPGDSTSSPGEQQSLWSHSCIFSPAQDNNLAVSLNKKRNDSIAFFNRWFQHKSWILYRCLLYMEPKIDSQLCRVPIKPDLSQKHKQHKSQRMKAALPCCCCCSTRKSLSLNVWTLSL